jgi:hypothetical protein
MAKQTFTTGQVLTAAQMTSLQQTAMGGGSTTAKTVSYTLVAADAGTVVQMNSASATTITVNTALFAAGDSVQIQNIGAGVCTVTAGTATVNTAGSLALSQWEGGQLYFNTTGASLFFDIVQASSTGGWTLDSTTTLSTASTSLTIPSGYKQVKIWIENYQVTASQQCGFRFNSVTTSTYRNLYQTVYGATTTLNAGDTASQFYLNIATNVGNNKNAAIITLENYENATSYKLMTAVEFGQGNPGYENALNNSVGAWLNTATISSLQLLAGSSTWAGGTAYVYGVK